MHEEVADRHLARDPGVVHLKARQVIDHAIVPADPAFIDQDPERGHREGLAGRARGEDGVDIHRLAAADRPHAEPPGKRHAVVLDDRNRHARHADLGARRLDATLEVLRR